MTVGCGSSSTRSVLSISASGNSLAVGSSLTLKAMITMGAAPSNDVTSLATWTSSNPATASVSSAGVVKGVAAGNATITASVNGSVATLALTITTPSGTGPTTPTVSSISLTPTSASVVNGGTQQFQAVAKLSDGTTKDITSTVQWTSSNASVATISSTGLMQAKGVGTAQIKATVAAAANGVAAVVGSATVTVTAASSSLTSITITPANPTVTAGGTLQLTATGTNADGTTQDLTGSLTWSTSNPAVATVTNGVITGVGPGTATITATAPDGTTTTVTVTVSPALVSLAIIPATNTITKGTTQQFTVTGTYTDGTTKDLTTLATWTSSNPAVISITSGGLATGLTDGSATLTATYQGQTASTAAIQDVAATTAVSGLSVVPTSARIALGTPEKLSAIASYADGSHADVSSTATWTSADPTIATIDANGLVTAVGTGTVTLTGTIGGYQSQTTLIVTPATLVSVAMSPTSADFAAGTPQKFSLIGTFSDGSTQDLSPAATWTSSDPAVATVSNTGLAQGVAAGPVQISASFGGQTAATSGSQVTPATLVSVAIVPSSPNLHLGTWQKFQAIGTFSDGTTADLSSMATWSSSDNTIVSMTSDGTASAIAQGSAQVSATVNGMTATSGSFTVTPATLVSVAITPSTPSFAAGTTQQFTATGTYSDGTTQDLTPDVVWSSSDPTVTTINQNGLAESGNPGTAQISATINGVTATSGSVSVTPATLVSFSISPTTASVVAGTTQQFTATGTYSDGTTQDITDLVTWASSNGSVASVTAAGLATGISDGSGQISASYMGQTVSTSGFAVTPATLVSIAITPSTGNVPLGGTQQFTATGTYSDGTTQDLSSVVNWSSSDAAVISVNGSGLASGTGIGSASLTATYMGQSISTSTLQGVAAVVVQVNIAPVAASIPRGSLLQLTTTAIYSDGSTADVTTETTWSSSAPTISSVSSTGVASGVNGGVAVITGAYNSITNNITLTVSPAALASLAITPHIATIADGTTQSFHAIGTLTDGSTQDYTSSVTWTSSSATTATISTTGIATGTGLGSTTITAQSGAASATATLNVTAAVVQSLSITPSTLSLPAGDTQQLLATATFSDGSAQDVTAAAVYTTSNPAVVSVSPTGLLHSNGTGSATVTIALGGTTTSLTVTVTTATLQSLAITPSPISLAAGTSQQLTATGTYSDGSTADLTNTVAWSSSNPLNAIVSASGNVYAVLLGTSTVTARQGSVNATAPVTVTSATISSITIDQGSVTLAAGQTAQLTATATLSDGTQQNVTSAANWGVSNPSDATISNVTGSNGLLTAIAPGNITVYATIGTTIGSTSVTIQTATLTSVALSPNPITIAAGTTQMITVTGSYSDGSTANLNASTTWTSSNLSVASVSSTGLLTATGVGTATLTANTLGSTASVTVTVSNAVLSSIAITPSAPSLNLGQQQQLTATGTYSDGSTADITALVHWSSTAPVIVTVSGTGLAISKDQGSATIMAALDGESAAVTLTVNPAALSAITVQAAQSSFALGTSLQLTATGTYTDGSTRDLTSTVTWSSLNPSVGVVSSTGLATGVTTGSFTAQAKQNGVTGTLAVTVSSATLVSIAVTPANSIIINLLSTRVQFVATGTFSDGTTAVLTTGVHWALTAGLNLGTIDANTGQFSPLGLGIGAVTATYDGVSGSTGFTIVSVL
ncbi:MAG TPA: Ig-like domain-containing protein [Granulicella sp.]